MLEANAYVPFQVTIGTDQSKQPVKPAIVTLKLWLQMSPTSLYGARAIFQEAAPCSIENRADDAMFNIYSSNNKEYPRGLDLAF